MRLRFFLADHSRLHQPSHIGVVAGYPRNLAVADEVKPRVADMHVIERVLYDRRCRAGGSHAPQLRMRKAVLSDLLVRRLQSPDQRRLRIVTAKVAIYLQQCFHGQSARFLAAFIAAHSVRHNRQPTLAEKLLVVLRLPITKRIFVILAQAADIGLDRHLNSGANFHAITISIAGMTSIGTSALTGKLKIIRVTGGTLKQPREMVVS